MRGFAPLKIQRRLCVSGAPGRQSGSSVGDRMASLVEHALETVPIDLVVVPTRGGVTARSISRSKPSVWNVAPSGDPAACQGLVFSYGVHPVNLAEELPDWRTYTAEGLRQHGIVAESVMLAAGLSPRNPSANYRVELMPLSHSPLNFRLGYERDWPQ